MRFRAAVLVVSCACGNSTSPSDAGAGDAQANDAASCDVTGSWKGTITGAAFPSGSSAIAFTLSGTDVITGTLTFGDAPPPPAPTDPNAAYPPTLAVSSLEQPLPEDFVEGFVFTVQAGTFDGARVRFGVASAEVFAAFCALQPEVWADGADGGAPYACLPPWNFFCNGQTETCVSTDPNDATHTITYSVEKQDLCSPGGTCTCSAQTCGVSSVADITFDLACGATALDGNAAGSLDPRAVHVTR